MDPMDITQSIFRWIHVVAGILWIGLLYFFNFVNVPLQGALDDAGKKAVNPMLDVYYWKDHQQREVDFVLKEKDKVRQLIQVSYSVSDAPARERETRSLLKASEELKCRNLLIITWDHEAEEGHGEKKIKFIPLWKWLLMPDSAGKGAKLK